MNYLELNHASTVSRQNWRALLLLVSGGLLCGMVIVYTQSLTREIERIKDEQQLISKPEKTLKKFFRSVEQDTRKQEETREINDAIDEIVMPWIYIFKALEAANHEEVKMLSVEPSAKSKKVRLTAVAFDIDSMMAYMQSLSEQNALNQVHLLSQEAVDVNGQSAIEFAVEAIWNR